MRVSGASLGISGRKDGVNEDESTNNLSTKTTTLGVTMGYRIGSTTQSVELVLAHEPFDHTRTADGSKTLHNHVEHCPGQ
ncbi:hypothetical protein HanIR_Chr13g0657141 [Helianthus annuus]|nr:hypothetical protein HanIR_Chr13g0657141 [Helianthus annuus]